MNLSVRPDPHAVWTPKTLSAQKAALSVSAKTEADNYVFVSFKSNLICSDSFSMIFGHSVTITTIITRIAFGLGETPEKFKVFLSSLLFDLEGTWRGESRRRVWRRASRERF